MQSRGIRRPSVCPSVCLSVCLSVCKLLHASRYFYHKHDSITTKLAHDGPHMRLHPGCAQGQDQGQTSRDTDTFVIWRKSLLLPQTWLDRHQTCTRRSPHGPTSRVCSRSRSRWRSNVTWYGHFCDFTKIATSTTNMTRSPPNLHTMVPTWAYVQGVLKVKVKVKGHVIRTLLWCHEMFTIQYLLTFCLYMHSLYEAPLHSPSISVRQIHVLSTSWNELLRHWRSGFYISGLCWKDYINWRFTYSIISYLFTTLVTIFQFVSNYVCATYNKSHCY